MTMGYRPLIPLHHHLPTPSGVAQWRSGADRFIAPLRRVTLRHLYKVEQQSRGWQSEICATFKISLGHRPWAANPSIRTTTNCPP